MFKLPQSILIAMVAVNITAFTIMMQMDMFSFGTTTAKVIAWVITIAVWRFAYMRRNRYFILF